MAGDAEIDPVLDLGGQIKDFEGHGSIPLQFLTLQKRTGGPAPYPRREPNIDIAVTDFNICQSISRDLLRPAGRRLAHPGGTRPVWSDIPLSAGLSRPGRSAKARRKK